MSSKESALGLEIEEVAWHRNGISGVGFYAIRFLWQPDDARTKERFLGIVFDEPGHCSVIGIDRLSTQGVAFAGGNSWRGDRFEEDLRRAIENSPTSGGVRIGPFCVPV